MAGVAGRGDRRVHKGGRFRFKGRTRGEGNGDSHPGGGGLRGGGRVDLEALAVVRAGGDEGRDVGLRRVKQGRIGENDTRRRHGAAGQGGPEQVRNGRSVG